MMRARIVVWFIVAVVFAPVRGAENEKLLDLINSSPSLTHAHIGWKFIEADTSKVLAEHEASNFFTPASNTKLYTTAAALVRLGVTYRFKTVVKTMGTVE